MKVRTLAELEHRCNMLTNLIKNEYINQIPMDDQLKQKRKAESPMSDITNKRIKHENINGIDIF